jgi:hypothetical protein
VQGKTNNSGNPIQKLYYGDNKELTALMEHLDTRVERHYKAEYKHRLHTVQRRSVLPNEEATTKKCGYLEPLPSRVRMTVHPTPLLCELMEVASSH